MSIRDWPQDTIFSLIRRIQAAPMEPGGWDRFHHLIGEMTSSHVGALYGYSYNSNSVQLVASLGWDAAQARSYAQYYSRRSVTQTDSEKVAPGEIYLETMSDPDALAKCEAYNEFFLPLRADHMVVMSLGAERNSRTKWGVRRSRRYGPYGAEAVALMRLIHPFLRQSMDLWGQIEGLRGLENTLYAALDRLPHGVLLLDGRGRVLFLNSPAEAILKRSDGLLLDAEGCLHAAKGDENRRLARLIGNALLAGLGQGPHPGGTIAVSRPSMKHALALHVFPIPTNNLLFAGFGPAAIIFVADPERKQRPPHRILAEMFGLTPSEEKLAHLLMEGLAIKDCAERLAITQSTARSYMKSIFSKTGVNRQGELIRLLFSSTLPMGEGEG